MGRGENDGIVYFSMRGSADHIYDLLDAELNLKRASTIQDIAKDVADWARGENFGNSVYT